MQQIVLMDAKIIPLEFNKIFTQKIEAEWLQEKNIQLDVLRLDLLHPVVSGNKWFKLQLYLKVAIHLQKTTIATFGGAYSNHIIATAFAAKNMGLKSVGIIRGENAMNSHTLKHAALLGMQLYFVDRNEYKNKESLKSMFDQPEYHWIDEGGYGINGAIGASTILEFLEDSYTDIIAAVGTGTMLAGLIMASNATVTGISSMKGNFSLEDAVRKLLPPQKLSTSFKILHDFHFGGYAKFNTQLLHYMNNIYTQHLLPLDFVYTAKTFYAIEHMVKNNTFCRGSKLLMIHSGGLQGNQSLPVNALSFL